MRSRSKTAMAGAFLNETKIPSKRFGARLITTTVAALCTTVLLGSTLAAPPAQARSVTYNLDIPAQSLEDALQALALASQHKLLYSSELVEGKSTAALKGEFTAEEAVQKLLKGTDLSYEVTSDGLVLIRGKDEAAAGSNRARSAAGRSLRLAQANPSSASGEGEDQGTVPSSRQGEGAQSAAEEQSVEKITPAAQGIPEILVTGSKLLNTDIRRTRDDAQPYVIFDREVIEHSGAVNLDDFLKQRLPMNAIAGSGSANGSAHGNVSKISLRGLGANQTLILVDGHRIAGGSSFGSLQQPNINTIPLSAVERIEVLPSAAAGIYGGGAVGGVVNIIMRRDYQGADVKLTYDDTFDSGSPNERIDITAGYNLNEGKTSLRLSGSYADLDPILAGDRNFVQRGRAAVLRNNPDALLPPTDPPMGATPNIKSNEGDLILDDGTPLDAAFTTIPVGYAGIGSDDGAGLIANAGTYNWDLGQSAISDTTGRSGSGALSQMGANSIAKSVILTARHQFLPTFEGFLELAASDMQTVLLHGGGGVYNLPADAPANPFQQSIAIAVPAGSLSENLLQQRAQNKNRRAVAGFIYRLGGNWLFGLDHTIDRYTAKWASPELESDPISAAIGAGNIDVFRDTQAFPVDLSPYRSAGNVTSPYHSTLNDSTVRMSGPLFNIPGGPVIVTGLLEYRSEKFGAGTQALPDQDLVFLNPARSQSVKSAYLETRLPLVSAANAKPGVRALELQLAVRRDEYKINGTSGLVDISNGQDPVVDKSVARTSSTDPTIGMRWTIVPDFTLRASFATGFLPPSVNQVLPNPLNIGGLTQSGLFDPQRGNTPITSGDVLTGGNANLAPEDSETFIYGLIFEPHFVRGLRLSVDYTRLKKTGAISGFPGGQAALLANESLFPGRVVRGTPTPAEQALGWAGPITLLDMTLFNVARAKVEAVDVQLDFNLETERLGRFDFYLLGTHQMTYDTQVLSGAPVVHNVGVASSAEFGGFANNPLENRANAGVNWNYGPWLVGWAGRYFDSYLVSFDTTPSGQLRIASQGHGGKVRSQNYHDLFVHYRFDSKTHGNGLSSLLSDVELELGIRNVLDTKPPFDASVGSKFYSQFGDPRLRSYWLSVRKEF